MFRTLFKQLSEKEIDLAISKLREEYDHYIVHFHKTAFAKYRFEDRLAQALRSRIDLTVFLGAEMRAVKELIEKAKHELEHPVPEKKPKQAKKALSYADQVIEKLRARIKGYPALGLPETDQTSPDVDKLYGTLKWFKEQVWAFVYPELMKKDPDVKLYQIDDELNQLTPWNGRFPKEIENYVHLLKSDCELSFLAKAQNRCLLLGAKFLYLLQDRMESSLARAEDGLWSNTKPKKHDVDMVKKTLSFAKRVLEDFRLKDFRGV